MTHAVPKAVHGNGAVREIEFEYVGDDMTPTGQTLRLAADQVFKAIGQTLEGDELPDLDGRQDRRGRHRADQPRRASGPVAIVPVAATT